MKVIEQHGTNIQSINNKEYLMKQQNQINLPFNLKVSYTEELQLKLSLHHNLQSKRYNRHWLVIHDFQDNQAFFITKKYLCYLQPGDLIKFVINDTEFEWKQKTQKQALNLLDFNVLYNQRKSQKIKKIFFDISAKIQKVYKENERKQYMGMKFLSVFIKDSENQNVLNKALKKLKSINNSDIYVNLFAKEDVYLLKQKFDFLQKWAQIKKLNNFQKQLKSLFFFINKICLKNLHLKILCKNGSLHSKEEGLNKSEYQNDSEWKLTQNSLLNSIYFVKANKIYVYQIQFRNLGYQEQYTFDISFICQDPFGRKYSSNKVFKLKPTRKQFQSIKGTNYRQQNEEKIRTIFDVNQSLTCQNLQMFQKLDQLKIIGKKIQIQIKQYVKNNEDTENQI